jgi:para-nitrobenzyl esterase
MTILKRFLYAVLVSFSLLACGDDIPPANPRLVVVEQGMLNGQWIERTKVIAFKGIPYAMAPIGELRWKRPQPPESWQGVRHADEFSHRCMQEPLFSDMQFRDSGMSEDCLFLNVWKPETLQNSDAAKLPVLVYFYGGGFVAGDGSEARYDGTNMAEKGIITVTVNYRLGIFGFVAHPLLSAEADSKASGNYGLYDQQAALTWVQNNIAAFGGDPNNITIAGESAGAISVTAHMLAEDSIPLFQKAIVESGSILLSDIPSLQELEARGERMFQRYDLNGRMSLQDLRAVAADQFLVDFAGNTFPLLGPNIDGDFFAQEPLDLLKQGKVAKVPLLAGVNSQEQKYQQILGEAPPSLDSFTNAIAQLYPEQTELVMAAYPGVSTEEILNAAQDLASDRFISASTWYFVDGVASTDNEHVYYYVYDHIRPTIREAFRPEGQADDEDASEDRGAVHSAEIEYFMGNLRENNIYKWTKVDFDVAKLTQEYVMNFIMSGNPNSGNPHSGNPHSASVKKKGDNLVTWPAFRDGHLRLSQEPTAQSNDQLRKRYSAMAGLFLE